VTDARNYALAAFATAAEPWLNALRGLQGRLQRQPELLGRLTEKGAAFEVRRQQLRQLLPDTVSDACRNFLFTLIERGDLGQLPAIVDWMGAMASGGPQARMAIVTTAYALDAQERQRFVATLQQAHGADLGVSFAVDASIVGGAVVRIGDQVVDGSVRARMEAIDGVLARGNG
jgi:F-type H+-transporting ATPase subunit delta